MGKILSISEITKLLEPIAKQHGVDSIWLFGSYARGEATDESDIDLLIDGGKFHTIWGLSGFRVACEDVIGKPVDVLTVNALASKASEDKSFHDSVEKDKVLLFAKSNAIRELPPDAIDVEVIGNTLLVSYANGEKRLFDVSSLLTRKCYAMLNDENYLVKAFIQHGTVAWPNNIDIDPEWLYEDSRPIV